MAINFHKLTVKQVVRETPECVSVVLDVPTELQNEFKFKQGQYLTFKDIKNDEEIRRSYSICSCPTEGELRVAVKKLYSEDVAKENLALRRENEQLRKIVAVYEQMKEEDNGF